MSAIAPSRQEMIEIDDEYRRLHTEHQVQESRLEAILRQGLPSQEDETEIKRIKLRKLALRDRMEEIRRSRTAFRQAATA